MKKKETNIENEQTKLKRKINILDTIFEGSAMFGGLLCVFATTALLMGATAAHVSDVTIDRQVSKVVNSAEYQNTVVEEGLLQLDSKLANGEISNAEYLEGIDALYSIPQVIEYMENSTDEELISFMEGYNKTQDMANTTLGKGLPIFASSAAVGIAGAATCYGANKKLKKKHDENEKLLENEKC